MRSKEQDISVKMSGERSELAVQRTILANSRTFSAWIRTGLAGGVLIPAAFAYIGDRTEQTAKKTRGKSMAFTGASIGTAAIVGPAFGGIMAARSKIEFVFVFISLLFLVTAFLILKFVEESYVTTDRGKFNFQDFLPLLKNPLMIQASLAAFTLMVSNGTLAFALPLNVEAMGLSTEITGALLSTFGFVALIVFLTPINRVFDQLKPVDLVIRGFILIGVSLGLLSITKGFIGNLLAMVVYGVGFAFVFPSMNRIVADASTQVDRGKAYGIFYAFFSLGAVAGSTISGIVAELVGLPFIVGAILMFLTVITLIRITQQTKIA